MAWTENKRQWKKSEQKLQDIIPKTKEKKTKTRNSLQLNTQKKYLVAVG